MTAAEARKLTDANSSEAKASQDVVPLLTIVYEKIHEAASKGKSSIMFGEAFYGIKGLITQSHRQTIARLLREDGFSVDSGHTFSDGSTINDTISW